MSTTDAVPITITPEASARLAELGMQAELGQMLEWVKREVPRLAAICVQLLERYDTGGEPGIWVEVLTRLGLQGLVQTNRDRTRWYVRAFPPQVREHFTISLVPSEENHAG